MNNAGDERVIAKDTTPISLDKIKRSRWNLGIRNREKYNLTKKSIRKRGVSQHPRLFVLNDGTYEVYIGDHRILILNELQKSGDWGDTAECYVDIISLKEAHEECILDNLSSSGYTPLQFEEFVKDMWETGNYSSKKELGTVLGKSGQRIGQILSAKKIRDELEASLKTTFTVSSEVLFDSRFLKDVNHRARLVHLVQNGKIYSKDTKNVAQLCQEDPKSLKKILYEGVSYYELVNQHRQEIANSLKKRKTKTSPISDPNPPKTIYQNTANNLNKHFLITTDERTRKQSIDYLKMTISLMAKKLSDEKAITKEQFEQIKDDILGVYRNRLDDYTGESLNKNNLGKWTGN